MLDAGALLAVERNDRDMLAVLKHEHLAHRTPVTHGGVIGQVWRGGRGRQANLARFLRGVGVVPLDDALGRVAGVMLAAAATTDVIDAAIVALAADGDAIYTSDPGDLGILADAAGLRVQLIRV